MSKPLAFLHVGLPKCASTFLQHVWSRDSAYDPVDIGVFVNAARKFALEDDLPVVEDVSGQVVEKPGITLMASSEGFSWAYSGHIQRQKRFENLHRVSALILGETNLSDKVLIMVRNPKDLIRAVHEQTIKEGGSDDFRSFLERQRKLLEGVMNLSLMIEEYGKFFEKIVVLSADELRVSPSSFWRKYSKELGAPTPSENTFESLKNSFDVNKSLGRRLGTLAGMNAFSKAQSDVFSGLPEYRQLFPAEHEMLTEVVNGHWKWLNRRIVEFGDEKQIEQIRTKLGLSGSCDDESQGVVADSKLHDFIETCYLAPLAGLSTIDKERIDGYANELAAITV